MKEQEYSSLSKLIEGFIKEHDAVIEENLRLRAEILKLTAQRDTADAEAVKHYQKIQQLQKELITVREIEVALSKENLKLKKEIEELRAPPHPNEIARRLDLL